MKSRWNEEEFKKAVIESHSIAEVLRRFSLLAQGANYLAVKRDINRLELNTDHFSGQGHLRNKRRNWETKNIPLEECLKINPNFYLTNSSKLKKRLLKEGLKKYECEFCNISTWRGAAISLQLDHIDGNRFNNNLENLRILCPNCHSQTPTYCSKNKKISNYLKRIDPKTICLCGKNKYYKSISCRSCNNIKKIGTKTKIKWPDHEELKKMISESNFTNIGKLLGVSDQAIRKRLRNKSKY